MLLFCLDPWLRFPPLTLDPSSRLASLNSRTPRRRLLFSISIPSSSPSTQTATFREFALRSTRLGSRPRPTLLTVFFFIYQPISPTESRPSHRRDFSSPPATSSSEPHPSGRVPSFVFDLLADSPSSCTTPVLNIATSSKLSLLYLAAYHSVSFLSLHRL